MRLFLTSRRWRLASGLVLFTYLVTHFTNHMLGLVSLEAAESGLKLALFIWHSLPGTILLYGAALIHFALALYTLYIRREWKLPPIEYLRLWAGFSLPLLLIGHATVTRLGASLHAVTPTYAHTVASIIGGGSQEWQIALLAPGWLHGCLGLWLSLRRYPLMRRLKPLLIGIVICVPLISAVGFMSMGRELVMRGVIAPRGAVAVVDDPYAAPPQKGLGNSYSASAPSYDPVIASRAQELRTWKDRMINIYIALIIAALLIGPVRRTMFGASG